MQWHWFKYLNTSSQCSDTASGSAWEELDLAIARSWFSSIIKGLYIILQLSACEDFQQKSVQKNFSLFKVIFKRVTFSKMCKLDRETLHTALHCRGQKLLLMENYETPPALASDWSIAASEWSLSLSLLRHQKLPKGSPLCNNAGLMSNKHFTCSCELFIFLLTWIMDHVWLWKYFQKWMLKKVQRSFWCWFFDKFIFFAMA